ncbi:hypothetical protein GQX73_g8972 [Xylaria multiplex]|uniref:Rhodopsin domain-containing protein n=1 Tax=Xylaria multiplex TaxID=323545 RepID=A0A7C8MK42_9PEZI|nr:hypothetical protein GQX73_g8972 [Xylaria multiplex]
MGSSKGTILLTGANGGLGSAIARQLASHQQFSGYRSLYAVRATTSAPNLSKAIEPERASHPHDVLSLNLADLDNVRDVAKTINTRVSDGQIPPIRAIILNAGFQDFGKQVWTDGFDTTFIANYLGHWLLTLLLLKSIDKSSGRIVVIGSQSHDPHDKRNESTGAFDDEKYKTVVHDQSTIDGIAHGSWSSAKEDSSWKNGYRRYGAAKLFSIMMIYELQSRMDRDPVLKNVCILGVDPGTMTTGLQRHASWVIRVLIFQIIYPIIAFFAPNGLIRSTHKSATQVLNAAFDLDSEPTTLPKAGYYFDEKPFETSAESKDVDKRGLVWKESVNTTIKIGFFVFYLRLFGTVTYVRYMVLVGMTVAISFCIVFVILDLIACAPLPGENGNWVAPSLIDRCNRIAVPLITAASYINVITDFYILFIPLHRVSKLRVSTRRKIGIGFIFLTGSLAAGAALANLIIRSDNSLFDRSDFSWTIIPVYATSLIEINVGLFCYSMPVVSALFASRFTSLSRSFGSWIRERRSPRPSPQGSAGESSANLANSDTEAPQLQSISNDTSSFSGMRKFIHNIYRSGAHPSVRETTTTAADDLDISEIDYNFHIKKMQHPRAEGNGGSY